MVVRVAIAGIGGRMGRELTAAVVADAELALIAGVVRAGSPAVGKSVFEVTGTGAPGAPVVDQAAAILSDVDVLIDFTRPDATVAHARACVEAGRPIVAGTSGLTLTQRDELLAIAGAVPVFYAPSMSLGVAVLLDALPAIARVLDGYDVEIVETHHRHKADAPSGTAMALAEAIASGQTLPLEQRTVYGRRGVQPRSPGEIGIHAVRAGGNAGEHAVTFASDGEQIQLTHRAYSRHTYALGALSAAKFIVRQPPGFYTMTDLLRR
jgi:4-hydroxy-tetrahydrodipicolinate reductase